VSTASHSTKSKKNSSTADQPTIAGRFAPSPTGPLHLGSLLAATASYLDARSRHGHWQVRIDDLDLPRNIPGADELILQALEAHALFWDGEVVYQSDRLDIYQHALTRLSDRLFYCTCSRRALRAHPVYPGTCRQHRTPRPDSALRIIVDNESIVFSDLVMGRQVENLSESVGDFIVRRRDGLIAYQLATAVDDGGGSISHVVRGSDLLDNTARQIFLMRCLGLAVPDYAHVPTLLNNRGQKLSKQHGAPALDISKAAGNLARVLMALGMNPPRQAAGWKAAELLAWALERWQLRQVPRHNSTVQR